MTQQLRSSSPRPPSSSSSFSKELFLLPGNKNLCDIEWWKIDDASCRRRSRDRDADGWDSGVINAAGFASSSMASPSSSSKKSNSNSNKRRSKSKKRRTTTDNKKKDSTTTTNNHDEPMMSQR